MTALVEFDVIGRPAPQGSKTAVVDAAGRARLLEGRNRGQRERHTEWREAVAQAAWVAMTRARRQSPILGPVEVTVLFRLPAPKALRRGVRLHHKRPDVDKLARATLDSLQVGGLIGDDAQVAHLDVWKVYALPGEPVGASVRVAALDPTDDSRTPGSRPWNLSLGEEQPDARFETTAVRDPAEGLAHLPLLRGSSSRREAHR